MNLRGKLSQLLNPRYSHCSHCEMTWNKVKRKSLNYNTGSGYFPICIGCYHDPKVSYSDLMKYYTNPHKTSDRFTQDEKDRILNSLFLETKSNDIIKEKYQKHIILKRSNVIDNILN